MARDALRKRANRAAAPRVSRRNEASIWLAPRVVLANTPAVQPSPPNAPQPAASKRIVYSALAAIAAVVAVGVALVIPRDEQAVLEVQTPPLEPVKPTVPEVEATARPPAPKEPANAHLYAFGSDQPPPADAFEGLPSPQNPTWKVAPGLDVAKVAGGFTYPVNLAFAEPPPKTDDAPWLYVSQLHGSILYLTRRGEVGVYAKGLLNFEPVQQVKTDETGLSGLAVIPKTSDLLVTTSYEDSASGLLMNRVLRLVGSKDGREMQRVEVLLKLPEFTSPSNQIQQVVIGPDARIYVAVGDAENSRLSLDLDKFGGKLLRMDMQGRALPDNPFYDPNAPRAARSYVFAYGLRNVFDFDFDPKSGFIFAGDNGKDIDRFARIERGASYGWNGARESIRLNALYTWHPAIAPCGLSFLKGDALGPGTQGQAVLAAYGPPAALGSGLGKALYQLELGDDRRHLARMPQTIVQYIGDGRATVLGVAEGPDGVYFTDFFGETREDHSNGLGTIWRVFPSEETRRLATGALTQPVPGDPVSAGRTHFFSFCASCHRLDGVGGNEGPDLTHFGNGAVSRLNSKAYAAMLGKYLEADGGFMAEQRERLLAVQKAKGRERLRTWLEHHLEEPRFDHPRAKMPSMGYLAPEVRSAIIEFVMSRVPQ